MPQSTMREAQGVNRAGRFRHEQQCGLHSIEHYPLPTSSFRHPDSYHTGVGEHREASLVEHFCASRGTSGTSMDTTIMASDAAVKA